MEWIDTSQPVTYQENEQTWLQRISWKQDERVLHSEVLYAYETNTFSFSTPYEEKGYFEPAVEEKNPKTLSSLLEDEDFSGFLENRKQIFNEVKSWLLQETQDIQHVKVLKNGEFQKTVQFPLNECVITAYFSKQMLWSLEEITLEGYGQKIRHAFQGTMVESKMELRLHELLFS